MLDGVLRNTDLAYASLNTLVDYGTDANPNLPDGGFRINLLGDLGNDRSNSIGKYKRFINMKRFFGEKSLRDAGYETTFTTTGSSAPV